MRNARALMLASVLAAVALPSAVACSPSSTEPAGASSDFALSLGSGTLSMIVGERVTLHASPVGTNGTPFAGLYTLAWASSSAAAVAVAADGTLTAQAAGSATVTATATRVDDGTVATASVAVTVGGGSLDGGGGGGGGGGSTLRPDVSGLCLSAAAAIVDGTRIMQAACAAAPLRFTETQDGVGTELRVAGTSFCIDLPQGSANDGDLLQLFHCDGSSDQRFQPILYANGRRGFKAVTSGRCFDIKGATAASGALVQQWSCSDTPEQRFSTDASGGGGGDAGGGGGDAGGGGGGAAPLPDLPAVSAPTIDKLEFLSASTAADAYWGGHQPRITHHLDGSVRVQVRPTQDNWQIWKKVGDGGSWSIEGAGVTVDDVFLMRDQVTDRAVVFANDVSLRTSGFASPDYVASPMAGTWQDEGAHYSGAGIGPDGTACFKQTSHNSNYTSDTSFQIMCGKYDVTTSSWNWKSSSMMDQPVGLRRGYDYIFPGADSGFDGFLDAAEVIPYFSDFDPRYVNDPAFPWVDNGVDLLRFGYGSTANWQTHPMVPPLAPINFTTRPERRQTDAFVDSSGRVFSTYWVAQNRDAPATYPGDGYWTTVADSHGVALHTTQWPQLPGYGRVRIFEDGSSKHWLISTCQGTSQYTCFDVYPLAVAGDGSLSIGAGTDLSSVFGNAGVWLNERSLIYLSSPRGGNPVRNYVDGLFVTQSKDYYYFRLRLP